MSRRLPTAYVLLASGLATAWRALPPMPPRIGLGRPRLAAPALMQEEASVPVPPPLAPPPPLGLHDEGLDDFDDDAEWARMQEKLHEAQFRLDNWGRGGAQPMSSWTSGSSLSTVIEETSSRLAKGKERVRAKAEAAMRRADEAARYAAVAMESKRQAERRAAFEAARAHEAEAELHVAMVATSEASTRAERAEAAATDAAAKMSRSEAKALAEAQGKVDAERRASEAASRASEASALAATEARRAADARADKTAELASAKAEAEAAEKAREAEAERAAAAEAATAASAAKLNQTEHQLDEARSELKEQIQFAAGRVTELDDAVERAQNKLARTKRALEEQVRCPCDDDGMR